MNKKPITIRPLKKEEETTLKSRLDKVEEIMRENDLFNLAVKYALLEEENQQLQSLLSRETNRKEIATYDNAQLDKQLDLYKSVLNEVREVLNYCIKHYGVHNMTTKDFDALLEILDKVGGSNE